VSTLEQEVSKHKLLEKLLKIKQKRLLRVVAEKDSKKLIIHKSHKKLKNKLQQLVKRLKWCLQLMELQMKRKMTDKISSLMLKLKLQMGPCKRKRMIKRKMSKCSYNRMIPKMKLKMTKKL
jgi:hypothetical protein